MGSYRPPDVFESLFDLTLSSGNVQRLQIVRLSPHPGAVVGLECREYVHPRNVKGYAIELRFFDVGGWGLGLTKMLRPEHVGYVIEHGERIRSLMARYKLRNSRV